VVSQHSHENGDVDLLVAVAAGLFAGRPGSGRYLAQEARFSPEKGPNRAVGMSHLGLQLS
jgi:hypothetical protein